MNNIGFKVAYDGTNYCGLQIQPNGNTIEAEIRQALEKSGLKFSKLVFAGRTDAGVHARAQAGNILTDSNIPPERLKFALNSYLPEDIRIIDSFPKPIDFNSRFNALGKHYRYFINFDKIPDPFKNRYSFNYTYPVKEDLIREAAQILSGKHDFNSYMASGSSIKDTVREIYLINPVFNENGLYIDYIANGFLYNMVRILTGTILQAGTGKIELERIKKSLMTPDRSFAGITVPAKGLFLEEVFYDTEKLKRKVNELKK